MRTEEIKNYSNLNTLAEQGGIVIYDCGEDKDIPTCEIRQAFAIESKIYNRSFDNLSITEAVSLYEKVVAPLKNKRPLYDLVKMLFFYKV